MSTGWFLALTLVLLPAATIDEQPAAHTRTTVFDIFEISPEQFATLMSKGDD